MKKRVEAGDPIAIYKQGVYYGEGVNGYQQDHKKAIELLFRANELGCVKSNSCIGYSYEFGRGMDVDKKKALHYYELAAMKGDSLARNNLGNIEARAGNFDRALRHYTIAVRDGFDSSLKNIQQLYLDGYATKEDYTKALQSYQVYLSEIKSDQRDRAAAADDEYRYY